MEKTYEFKEINTTLQKEKTTYEVRYGIYKDYISFEAKIIRRDIWKLNSNGKEFEIISSDSKILDLDTDINQLWTKIEEFINSECTEDIKRSIERLQRLNELVFRLKSITKDIKVKGMYLG